VKTVVAVGWPVGLGLIMLGLAWWLVEDIVRERRGEFQNTSPIGPCLAVAGALVLAVMLFIPASYEPI
jgi:thiol:disulfide interchange protein